MKGKVKFLIGCLVVLAAIAVASPGMALNIVIFLLSFVAAAGAALFVHELGHVLGAFITGRKVIKFSLGPITLSIPQKKIIFSWKNFYYVGNVLVDVADFKDEASYERNNKKQSVIFILGPVMSLVTGILALTLLKSSFDHMVVTLFGILSLAMGLGTLIFSDGRLAKTISDPYESLYYYWNILFTIPHVKEESLKFLLLKSETYLFDKYIGNKKGITEKFTDLFVLYYSKYFSQVIGRERINAIDFMPFLMDDLRDESGKRHNKMIISHILCEEAMGWSLAGRQDEAESLYAFVQEHGVTEPITRLKVESVLKRSMELGREYAAQRKALVQNNVFDYYEEKWLKERGLPGFK
ncbi:site-2 protease family protein [Paenibacillus chitinolyticus]|uniref:site-2 protease family protein n=1 Tax=Paenibacillus chitinolyticus TaxID=79263 RepID=UPI003672718D